ncbi:hypothetical protein LOY91_005181 [Ophidiomyces ophidiicola]|nr:hypothetical protein LOY91_005181 [Ophidiomyces ophidiicola]
MRDMSRADKNSSNSTGTPSSDNEQKNNDKPSANVPEDLTTITKSKARRLKRRAAIQQLNMGDDEPPKRGGEPDIELMRHVKKSWFRSNGYGSSSTGPFTIPRGYPGSVSADPSANIPEGHHPDNPPRASDETGGKTKRTRKKKGKGKGKEGTGMQQEINHGIFRLEQRNALIEGYSFLRDDKSPGPFSDSNKRSASAPPRIIGFDILKDGSEETSKGASEETSKGISEEVCKLPEEVPERMPEEIREHCEQTTFESHGIVFGHCSPVLRNAVPLLEGSLLPELLSSLAVPTRDIGRHAPFAQVVPEQSVIYPPPHFAPALPQQNYQYSHLHGHQNGYYYPYYQGPYLSSWHAPYHSLSRDPS